MLFGRGLPQERLDGFHGGGRRAACGGARTAIAAGGAACGSEVLGLGQHMRCLASAGVAAVVVVGGGRLWLGSGAACAGAGQRVLPGDVCAGRARGGAPSSRPRPPQWQQAARPARVRAARRRVWPAAEHCWLPGPHRPARIAQPCVLFLALLSTAFYRRPQPRALARPPLQLPQLPALLPSTAASQPAPHHPPTLQPIPPIVHSTPPRALLPARSTQPCRRL